jgi:hypothetical protein
MKPLRSGQISLILLLLTVSSFAQSPAPSPNDKIPTVNYCDLIHNAASYDRKVIRVRALYVVGFEAAYLYDPACNGKSGSDKRVWIEYSDSFEKSSKPEVERQFHGLLKSSKDNKYSPGRVEVVFVGKFDGVRQITELKRKDEKIVKLSVGYGHLNGYDYQITVDAIEEVKSVPKKSPW